MLLITNDENEIVRLQKDGGGEGSGDTAVAVLERMNLCEAMVEPGGFDFRTGSGVCLVPIEQPFDLVTNEFGRTVLVKSPVGNRLGLFGFCFQSPFSNETFMGFPNWSSASQVS